MCHRDVAEDTGTGPGVPRHLPARQMADAAVMGTPRSERFIERVKTVTGVLAGLAGAITGLWTVYDKVKTDARQYTAASYETLAPQVNQLTEALKSLEQQNRELHEALLTKSERARAPA